MGVNPKVNNLVRPYHEAANDILWVLDSNVTVASGVLARSVDTLLGPPSPSDSSKRKRIGVVHHVPFAFGGEAALGSKVEEAFLNTNHAKMYLAINTVALESCVVGKSNLYRRSDVDRINGSLRPLPDGAEPPRDAGLEAFGRFLAEDNMIASALWHELGLRHDLSCDVARNSVSDMTLSDYIWRRVRWIRVRKHIVLSATALEPFTECFLLSAIGAASLHHIFSAPIWLFLLLHFGLWLLVDMDVYTSLAGHSVPATELLQFVGSWVTRELFALPIFLLAIFGNEVEWRGQAYLVLGHGEVKRVERGARRGRWLSSSWGQDSHDYEPLSMNPD